ncbi:MAG: BrnT family toxin, partial [Spirochaetaceae bacterium]|nr:BrnT family toxin [Spirochaetaceae bacterium]
NKREHGLYFNEILPAFDDPYLIEYYDEAHSTFIETRLKGLADLQGLIVLYLSYTENPTGRTRIISARPAESIEERAYYEWRKNFII